MATTSAKSSGTRTGDKKSTIPMSGKTVSTKNTTNVAQRAYEIYLKRVSSGKPGDQVGDWLQAESELHPDK
jgi:hypothetical protein